MNPFSRRIPRKVDLPGRPRSLLGFCGGSAFRHDLDVGVGVIDRNNGNGDGGRNDVWHGKE